MSKPSKLVFRPDQVDEAIVSLAHALNRKFDSREVLVCPILEGGLVFAGKLLTKLRFNLKLGSIYASRYGNDRVGKSVKLRCPLPELEGKHVLLLDEMLDKGTTLREVVWFVLNSGALSVTTCVLLDRTNGQARDIEPDFVGLHYAGDAFLVGEGLDSRGLFRNLPGVWEI